MDPLVWAIVLLVVGLILVLVEFFVPSSGVLALLAFACLTISIIMAFRYSGGMGLLFMAVAVIGAPLLLAAGVRMWPHTPIGRRLLLGNPTPDEVLPDTPLRRELKSLLGKVGRARSLMMPSGAVEIEGLTIDALSEGLPIEPGTAVKVIEVRGMQVVVRPETKIAPTTVAKSGDVLAQPIESLGLDELSDPLS